MSRYDMKFARRVSLLHVLSSLELAFAFSLEPTSARRRASPRTRAPVLDQVRAAIALGIFPRVLVPIAPVLMRPLQHLQVASLRAMGFYPNTSRCPPSAAHSHVPGSNGHPF
jgi:hypothetical protein